MHVHSGHRLQKVSGYNNDPHPTIKLRQRRVAVVPVALNSGLFWGRHNFIKNPARIVIEFMPPIAPGIDRRKFLVELEEQIEAATAVLIAEATGDNSGDGSEDNSVDKPVYMSS